MPVPPATHLILIPKRFLDNYSIIFRYCLAQQTGEFPTCLTATTSQRWLPNRSCCPEWLQTPPPAQTNRREACHPKERPQTKYCAFMTIWFACFVVKCPLWHVFLQGIFSFHYNCLLFIQNLDLVSPWYSETWCLLNLRSNSDSWPSMFLPKNIWNPSANKPVTWNLKGRG